MPRKFNVGSNNLVFCKPMKTGSVRFSVPKSTVAEPFARSALVLPTAPGIPTSGRKRPPRSKILQDITGLRNLVWNQRSSDKARIPLWRICSGVGRRHGLQDLWCSPHAVRLTVRASTYGRLHRCYRVPLPTAYNRGSSCFSGSAALRWRGIARKQYERHANRQDS